MTKTPTGLRHRWLWALLGVVVVLAVAAIVGFVVWRDTATPVSVSEAVETFRADPPETSTRADDEARVAATAPVRLGGQQTDPAPGDLPPSGVYVYRTTGGEEVDALGGTRHDYPAETTITVRSGGCGAVHRWHALEERFEEWEVCRRDGTLVMPWFTAFHQFFGTDDRQEFTCDPVVVLVAAEPVGTESTATCRSEDLTEVLTLSLQGPESIVVDEEERTAVHVHIDVELDGGSVGGSTIDMWLDEIDAVLLRWTETDTSTTGSPIGDVRYDEDFELVLTSRRALR